MEIVFHGDNLHELSNPVSWDNNKKINISTENVTQVA